MLRVSVISSWILEMVFIPVNDFREPCDQTAWMFQCDNCFIDLTQKAQKFKFTTQMSRSDPPA